MRRPVYDEAKLLENVCQRPSGQSTFEYELKVEVIVEAQLNADIYQIKLHFNCLQRNKDDHSQVVVVTSTKQNDNY